VNTIIVSFSTPMRWSSSITAPIASSTSVAIRYMRFMDSWYMSLPSNRCLHRFRPSFASVKNHGMCSHASWVAVFGTGMVRLASLYREAE
jgi:hypothetical protein